MTSNNLSPAMAVVIMTLIGGAVSLGIMEGKVEATATAISETKLSTAILAASQRTAEIELRERVSRLEERNK